MIGSTMHDWYIWWVNFKVAQFVLDQHAYWVERMRGSSLGSAPVRLKPGLFILVLNLLVGFAIAFTINGGGFSSTMLRSMFTGRA